MLIEWYMIFHESGSTSQTAEQKDGVAAQCMQVKMSSNKEKCWSIIGRVTKHLAIVMCDVQNLFSSELQLNFKFSLFLKNVYHSQHCLLKNLWGIESN